MYQIGNNKKVTGIELSVNLYLRWRE